MAETTNLQKSYSAMNEKIVNLFDNSGVRRAVTVPYIEGQSMADHVTAAHVALAQVGGTTNNLILSGHHSDGNGWGSGDGHTVAYSADKLRTTLIPPDSEHAKSAINAAQKHISNLAALMGKDNPEIQTAQNQLNLVKKTDGDGMTLLDFGVLLTQIMYRPTQMLAKLHSGTKPGGHAAHLRGPVEAASEQQDAPDQDAENQGGTESEEGGEQDAQAAPAPAAPQAAPQEAAPAQG